MREYVFHPDDEKYFKLTKNDKPTLAIAVPKSYKYLAEEGARFCVENNTSAYRAVNTYLYEKFDCVVGTMCRNMNWKQLKESFKEGIRTSQSCLFCMLDSQSLPHSHVTPFLLVLFSYLSEVDEYQYNLMAFLDGASGMCRSCLLSLVFLINNSTAHASFLSQPRTHSYLFCLLLVFGIRSGYPRHFPAADELRTA
jgi:hypothetical protein